MALHRIDEQLLRDCIDRMRSAASASDHAGVCSEAHSFCGRLEDTSPDAALRYHDGAVVGFDSAIAAAREVFEFGATTWHPQDEPALERHSQRAITLAELLTDRLTK